MQPHYLLWSIGPDGKDDGGVRGSVFYFPSTFFPYYEGDWVWSFVPDPVK